MLILGSFRSEFLDLLKFFEVRSIYEREIVWLQLWQLVNNNSDLFAHISRVNRGCGGLTFRKKVAEIPSEQNCVKTVSAESGWKGCVEDLKYDASNAPHVLSLVILLLNEQYLWCAVPPTTEVVCKAPVPLAHAVDHTLYFWCKLYLCHLLGKVFVIIVSSTHKVPNTEGITASLTYETIW